MNSNKNMYLLIRPFKKILTIVPLYFSQFNFFYAIKFCCARVSKSLFNAGSTFNYSQTGEQHVIQFIVEKYMPHVEKGFYIDVGCNHPIKGSNTFYLYSIGWRGLCIDANEGLMKKFKKIRPKDYVCSTAISDVAMPKTYYEFESSCVNTLDETLIEEWKSRWILKSQKEIITQSLNDVLEELHLTNQRIDVLSVDVEGFDFNVIKSIDLKKYAPGMIVVELNFVELMSLPENEIVQYLAQYEYYPVAFATINAYFVKGAKK